MSNDNKTIRPITSASRLETLDKLLLLLDEITAITELSSNVALSANEADLSLNSLGRTLSIARDKCDETKGLANHLWGMRNRG